MEKLILEKELQAARRLLVRREAELGSTNLLRDSAVRRKDLVNAAYYEFRQKRQVAGVDELKARIDGLEKANGSLPLK